MTTTPPITRRRRRSGRIWTAARLCISISLVVWLVSIIDISESFQILFSAWGPLLGAAVVSVALTHVCNCWRWRLCLVEDRHRIDLRTLVVSYWTSLFAGLVLPSEYGGDLLRIRDVWNRRGGAAAAASITWSRFSGLWVALFVFSAVGLLRAKRLAELGMGATWTLSMVVCLLLALLMFVLPVPALLGRWIDRLPRRTAVTQWLVNAGRQTLQRMQSIARQRRIGLQVFFLAFAAQGLMIGTNTLYCLALGRPVAVLDMTLMVPLITLSSILPVSIAGIGVKEGAFVVCLAALGFSHESALAVGLLNRLVLLGFAGIGGLIFPFRPWLLRRGPEENR